MAKRFTLAGGLAIGAVGLAAYRVAVRPWHLRWGATREEIGRAMPLDDDDERPDYVTNRAITIHARPEDAWPWLVQMGELPRGGFYSYLWIERLIGMAVANADRVLPEFQRLLVGQRLDRSGNMRVKAVEPNRFLVLGPPDALPHLASTWAIALYPREDGDTRLVSRVRARFPPGPRGWFWRALLDPGQFVMERKMLLEIKRRAEALAGARAAAGLASMATA
jgi:hypothetical protein